MRCQQNGPREAWESHLLTGKAPFLLPAAGNIDVRLGGVAPEVTSMRTKDSMLKMASGKRGGAGLPTLRQHLPPTLVI